MFTLGASHVIPEVVEAMLPRGTRNKVLILTMLASVGRKDEYGASGQRQTRIVHFLFYRPSNYTKVGLLITDGQASLLLARDHVWSVVSDHDSCWKSDGVDHHLSRLYFEMCKQVDPDTAPVNLEADLRFPALGGIELLTVADCDDAIRYNRPDPTRDRATEWTIQFKYAPGPY